VLAVEDSARQAVEAIRHGGGPHFLEMRTYRFRAHSMYDPDRYRDKAEVTAEKGHDPIAGLTDRLRADGHMTDEQLATIEQELTTEIAEAIEFADQAPLEPVEQLTRFVHSERVLTEVTS
jgi:pyruvate dehydrogenase E1 component subunit alpha